MRVKLRHVFLGVFLLGFFQVLSGCSSSQEQQEELIEAEGEEVSADAGAEGNEAAEEGASAEGEEAQGNYAAEGGEEAAEGGYENNYGGEEGGEEVAEDGAVTDEAAGDEAMAAEEGAEGQGDLQEIIDEMNQNGAPAEETAATDDAAAAEGSDADAVLAGGEAAAPEGTENIAVADAAPAMEAAAPMDAPAAAPVSTAGLPEMNSKMSYVVQKGDSLAKVAQKIYGDMSKWKEMAELSGLENPSWIYPGDVVYYRLTEQSMAFAGAYENVARAEVTVQAGDTLSTIATKVLGDSSSWKSIWRENDNINNPDQLEVGSVVYYIAPGTLTAALDASKNIATTEVNAIDNAETVVVSGTSAKVSFEQSTAKVANSKVFVGVKYFKNNKV